MAKKIPYINLLRHQEKKLLDKFLDWAFTIGRAIVIITESVALSAFAYRFVLDRQIIDLRDKIKQEQAIVKLSQVNELKFRNLQNRLTLANTLDAESLQKTTLLTQILQKARGKMAFRTIQMTKTGISLEGSVPSVGSIASFVADLRAMPQISKVTIGTIENSTTRGVINTNIQADLRGATQNANQ